MPMVMRTTILLGILALVASFAAGFAFDRWLHRPITAGGMTLQFVDNSAPRIPPSKTIQPCIARCSPDDPTGDESTEIGPDDATQASCYGDGSIPCPGAQRQRPFGTGYTRGEPMCWWEPFGFNACQKET